MKSRDGKSQRREEKKKEKVSEERKSRCAKSLRRKKIQVGEKVGKSRNTLFFQWFVAPEGRQVGSLKRRAQSQLARWEMKNCTPLWREAHFEVKMHKAHQVRTTFGSWDVEKVHAVVARSTFRSQNVQNTPLEHFSKLRCLKKCTPLWREAHFEVKMHKAHQVRTTFGSWDGGKVHAVVARSTFRSQNVQSTPGLEHFSKLRCRKSARRCGGKHISKSKCTKHLSFRALFKSCDVEKVHAVVARSTFRSQNLQNTPGSDHFWKLRWRKSARRCGAKHISKSKCTKQTRFGPLLEVEMSKKCTPLWREAHFEVKSAKNWLVRSTFGRSDLLSRGRRKGLCTLSKVSKTWGFCSISKNDGRRGAFEEDLQRCIFRGRRSARDMFIRAVRRSARWFPERGCILEPQIFRFAEMILRDWCNTSYDLASLFRGRCSSLDRWSGKIAKRIGTRPSALHSTFYFWRKSRRILSFLILSTSKNEEVSQNCIVFDVVKLKYWGSLAELLRFWCCQLWKPEDVSQNSLVCELADRQVDRQRQTDR